MRPRDLIGAAGAMLPLLVSLLLCLVFACLDALRARLKALQAAAFSRPPRGTRPARN